MRELKMVGLDADSKYIICEGDDPAEQFKLAADDRLRDLLRGEAPRRSNRTSTSRSPTC